MLKDLDRILDGQTSPTEATYIRRKNIDEAHFAEASQHLLQHQFLYRADRGCEEKYDLIIRFKGYFDDLFASLGFTFVLDDHVHYVGILPAFENGRVSWRMDETILLLVLRATYQQGIEDAQVDDHGAILVLSEEMLSQYEVLTQKPRPSIGRLKDILAEFRRRGLVSFDQFEEKETIIAIRPAIGTIMGGDFMQRLVAFNDADNVDNEDSDGGIKEDIEDV